MQSYNLKRITKPGITFRQMAGASAVQSERETLWTVWMGLKSKVG
ncbi:hypothetical protein ANO14919_108140 [Xylariales sp. No.14919]|nr:hypothetical protein ANO14919_108140 [Xylariales sp. No.14919]